ncbi:integrase domain-containing protein [Aliagarivorans taiwanensis]|uniref:integrase domain-containing protein n=1 Tax=Aliagarivorans taiwanensis TaxID=561966 RepID=UPI0003F93BA6|nr:integrase domain-containing protein [Aliagarivorans taiwanensis]
MARKIKPLSDRAVKEAKPTGKVYRLYDGGGLMIVVSASGSKTWVQDYKKPLTQKRSSFTIGKYPHVSLKQARCERDGIWSLIAKGIDPKEHKSDLRKAAHEEETNTLQRIAEQWLEVKKSSVTADYATDIWRSLELHIFPKLGRTPITKIDAPQTIEVLKALDATGAKEQVRRVVQRLNEIMTFAVNTGLLESNPLTGIKAAFSPPKKNHLATLPPAELPRIFAALQLANIKTTTRLLIEFQLHTMVRPGEAVKARWQDIDIEHALWIIPAEFMKKKRPHRVPLTEPVIGYLHHLKPLSGHRTFVFPGNRDPKTHMNEQTANMALKRAGLAGQLVAHGMRSIASTALNEQGFRYDVVEHALAHADKNELRAAYNRSDYLNERRELMQWWSNYIVEAKRKAYG